MLLCRAAGLRKAAASGVGESLGGPAEMERLLGLRGKDLQAEWDGIPTYLREMLHLDTLGGQVMTSATRVCAVMGLFQQWLFHGIRQCGHSNRAVKRTRRDVAPSVDKGASDPKEQQPQWVDMHYSPSQRKANSDGDNEVTVLDGSLPPSDKRLRVESGGG